jgi:tellurite resistance protein TerC
VVLALLALDLLVSGRRGRTPSASARPPLVGLLHRGRRSRSAWSSARRRLGLRRQYFAGYIVEKSLSVDNLFVFVIIMSTFAVPASTSSRC